MDFHRALSALFTNQAAVQPLLGSLGFPFNDGTSILTTALAAQSGGKKLDTPLGILPFDSLPTTNLLTPTKKIKLEDELCASPVSSRSSTVSSSHVSWEKLLALIKLLELFSVFKSPTVTITKDVGSDSRRKKGLFQFFKFQVYTIPKNLKTNRDLP